MLQHMHHDASLASSSRELLQQLVNSYPSTPMVIVTLHTFTQLAASSLIDIPKQVRLKRACRRDITHMFWKTAEERFSPDVHHRVTLSATQVYVSIVCDSQTKLLNPILLVDLSQ